MAKAQGDYGYYARITSEKSPLSENIEFPSCYDCSKIKTVVTWCLKQRDTTFKTGTLYKHDKCYQLYVPMLKPYNLSRISGRCSCCSCTATTTTNTTTTLTSGSATTAGITGSVCGTSCSEISSSVAYTGYNDQVDDKDDYNRENVAACEMFIENLSSYRDGDVTRTVEKIYRSVPRSFLLNNPEFSTFFCLVFERLALVPSQIYSLARRYSFFDGVLDPAPSFTIPIFNGMPWTHTSCHSEYYSYKWDMALVLVRQATLCSMLMTVRRILSGASPLKIDQMKRGWAELFKKLPVFNPLMGEEYNPNSLVIFTPTTQFLFHRDNITALNRLDDACGDLSSEYVDKFLTKLDATFCFGYPRGIFIHEKYITGDPKSMSAADLIRRSRVKRNPFSDGDDTDNNGQGKKSQQTFHYLSCDTLLSPNQPIYLSTGEEGVYRWDKSKLSYSSLGRSARSIISTSVNEIDAPVLVTMLLAELQTLFAYLYYVFNVYPSTGVEVLFTNHHLSTGFLAEDIDWVCTAYQNAFSFGPPCIYGFQSEYGIPDKLGKCQCHRRYRMCSLDFAYTNPYQPLATGCLNRKEQMSSLVVTEDKVNKIYLDGNRLLDL